MAARGTEKLKSGGLMVALESSTHHEKHEIHEKHEKDRVFVLSWASNARDFENRFYCADERPPPLMVIFSTVQVEQSPL